MWVVKLTTMESLYPPTETKEGGDATRIQGPVSPQVQAAEEIQSPLELHLTAEGRGKCAWFISPTVLSPSNSPHWLNLSGRQLTLESRNAACGDFRSQPHRAKQGKNEEWKTCPETAQKPPHRKRPILWPLVAQLIKKKKSAFNVGDLGSIPGLGRSSGEGKGYPLQCSGLKNSMDYTVHGVAKSWT